MGAARNGMEWNVVERERNVSEIVTHGATSTQNTRPHHHQPAATCETPPSCHPQHGMQDHNHNKQPQQWQQQWSSSGDIASGGQWDGGSRDGSNSEALLLPQTVHILSMQ